MGIRKRTMTRQSAQYLMMGEFIIVLILLNVVRCSGAWPYLDYDTALTSAPEVVSKRNVNARSLKGGWQDEINDVLLVASCPVGSVTFVSFNETIQSATIEPAKTIDESKERFEARKIRKLLAAANAHMPIKNCRERSNSFPDSAGLNPDMDSRRDAGLWSSNAVARILAGLPNPDLESILTDTRTKQFANMGTSSSSPNFAGFQCARRPADYDFALIDLLNLYFVAREHDPNYELLSEAAVGRFSQGKINGSGLRGLLVGGRIVQYPHLKEMTYNFVNCTLPTNIIKDYIVDLSKDDSSNMTIREINSYYDTSRQSWLRQSRPKSYNQIRLLTKWLERIPLTISIEDTENHFLQTGIGIYLTNQIMLEMGINKTLSDTQSINKDYLLRKMAEIARNHFYEYNSKPYQKYTTHALTTLYSYSNDTQIRDAAKSLLDIASLWTAVGSNKMRRFAPVRRQTKYSLSSDSSNDPEFLRFATLVGSSHSQESLNDLIAYATVPSLFTVSGKYRLADTLLELAIKDTSIDADYFRGYHSVPEIYSYSANVLISSGGFSSVGRVPDISVGFGNPVIPIIKSDRLKRFVEKWILGYVTDPSNDNGDDENLLGTEFGWARPTIIIPTNEVASSWTDMIRYEGDRSLQTAVKGHNTCVAPGFACGYQLKFPDKYPEFETKCSVLSSQNKNMRFFDLNQLNGTCPYYGLYLAIYKQSCSETSCSNFADDFGFIEVVEAKMMSFDSFIVNVEKQNPSLAIGFQPEGNQRYTTHQGLIVFEFIPTSYCEPLESNLEKCMSPIIEVFGDKIPRDFKKWPRAISNRIHSMEGDFVQVNSTKLQKLLTIDMRDPLHPKNSEKPYPFDDF